MHFECIPLGSIGVIPLSLVAPSSVFPTHSAHSCDAPPAGYLHDKCPQKSVVSSVQSFRWPGIKKRSTGGSKVGRPVSLLVAGGGGSWTSWEVGGHSLPSPTPEPLCGLPCGKTGLPYSTATSGQSAASKVDEDFKSKYSHLESHSVSPLSHSFC